MLPVFGFEDTYTVSMYGEIVALSKKVYQENHPFQKIRNTKQKVLKQHDAGKGYLFVVLFDGKGKKKRMYVHRIVLQAFKPTSHELLQVNHIDGNKKNNHIENLEWCTCSENHVHAYATGLRS